MAIKYEIRDESGKSAYIGGGNCFASEIDAQREIDYLRRNGWTDAFCIGEYRPRARREDDDDDLFGGGEYQSEYYRCNDREYYRE